MRLREGTIDIVHAVARRRRRISRRRTARDRCVSPISRRRRACIRRSAAAGRRQLAKSRSPAPTPPMRPTKDHGHEPASADGCCLRSARSRSAGAACVGVSDGQASWLRRQGPGPGRRTSGGGRSEGTVTVTAATARLADVPVTIDAVGTVQALNTVTIRHAGRRTADRAPLHRGTGRPQRRHRRAEIDPALYQAQYDQAVAKKAQDEANLANARRRSRALREAHRRRLRLEAATRHAKGVCRAAGGAGARRSERRSTTPKRRSTMRRSARRSTDAPASGSSTSAIFCTPRTRPALSSSRN